MAERPVGDPPRAHTPDRPAQESRRHPGHEPLHPEHGLELPPVTLVERVVPPRRGGPRPSPVHDRAKLAAQRDSEVEGGPDPLRGQREAVARRVAAEEDAILGGRPEPVRDPVALVANRVAPEVLRQLHGGVLDVEAGVERAHPDPQLVARGEAPAVAGGHVPAVDPDLHVVAGPARMDLEPPRQGGVGRLIVAVAARQHPTPPKSVDDQRRGDFATVRVDGRPRAPVHLGGLEASVVLGVEQDAELRVVEGRERPGEGEARGAVRRVDHQLRELLPRRALEAHRVKPLGGDAAGRRLPLADLIAVHEQDLCARAGQLAGHREPGEAGAADQDVGLRPQRRALGAALGPPLRHRPKSVAAAPLPLG